MVLIGKEAYKTITALVVTLLATIGAAYIITSNQTDSNEMTTAKFNSKVPMIVNFTKTGKSTEKLRPSKISRKK